MNAVQTRRAGLVLVVLMILVFGTEATLARLRRRDLRVVLSVQHAAINPADAVPAATGTPNAEPDATQTPGPALLVLTPTDQLAVTVLWDYSIGPRFYKTQITALAQINGRIVAQGQVNIDCGQAALSCNGTQSIALTYTVPDTGSGVEQVAWPPGDYQLIVNRSDGGLAASLLQQTPFTVH